MGRKSLVHVLLVCLPAFLYGLLHLVGWQYPLYMWGVDQLHYYPTWVCSLMVVASLGPGLALWRPQWVLVADQWAQDRLEGICQYAAGWSVPIKVPLLGLFFSVCYIFRVRAHLLGDSAMWLQNLKILRVPGRETEIDWIIGLPLAGYEHLPALQALDFGIHLQVYRLGHDLFGWQPQDAYEWISCMAGIFYVAVLWKLAVHLGTTRSERLTFFVFLLTLGNLQFFFGYGESYTLATATMALYALYALRYLRDQGSLLAPSLVLALTLLLHLMPMALVPSWFYLLWRHPGRLGVQIRRPAYYLPLAVIGTAAVLALYLGFYQHHHLPLWTPEEEGRFPILSLPHLTNLGNQLLLMSPFGLVWGLASRYRRLAPTTEIRFLGFAALGAWGLIGVHNITMGGRDWDLMALPCLFYSLWGLLCLLQADREAHMRQIRLVVIPLMCLHTALWIGINADEGRGEARLQNLLRFGPNQPVHYQEFTQGYYLLNIKHGDYPRAVRHLQAAIEGYHGDDANVPERYTRFLAQALQLSGRDAEAAELFARIYADVGEIYERDLSLWRIWLFCLYRMGLQEIDPARARRTWEQAVALCDGIEAFDVGPAMSHVKGVALFELGQFGRAIVALRRSVESEQDATQRYVTSIDLARALLESGQPAEAIRVLEETAKLRPEAAQPHALLGGIHYGEGRLEEAVSAYRQAVAREPQHARYQARLAEILAQAGRR